MKKQWKPVYAKNNSKNWLNLVMNLVGIGLFLLMTLCLFSCTRTEYRYVEVEREPITCHKHIKTYLDIAKCLEEYKAKW